MGKELKKNTALSFSVESTSQITIPQSTSMSDFSPNKKTFVGVPQNACMVKCAKMFNLYYALPYTVSSTGLHSQVPSILLCGDYVTLVLALVLKFSSHSRVRNNS